jgi:gliding motility-associated-like protein
MKNYILATFCSLISLLSFGQLPISVDAANNNASFSTCNGFIFGSQGSPSGGAYLNGENVTFTICADVPGDNVSVVFNFFQLSLVDDNPAPNATNVDYMEVYDGPTTAANSLGVYQGTELQGVIIQTTVLNTTGCLTFRFRSNSAGTGQFTGSATCTTPCSDPFAAGGIVGGITSDSIIVCVGESVSFAQNGSFAQPGFAISQYEWDFMDGDVALGQNVSHAFDLPGRYRVQLFVTDDNADYTCTNNNLIDLQVIVSTIPTFDGFQLDTTLCLGESLIANADPPSWEVTWNGFPNSSSTDDGCLPDTLLGVSQNIDLTQTGFIAGSTITNINQIQSICVDLEHSFMGDLVVILNCPNGQNAILHQQGGGGTQIGIPNQDDNVDCSIPATQGVPFTYCFTPTATQTWVEWVNASGFGGTIPAGNYESIQPLSNFIGCPLNGVWTITVIDNWASDDGTLFSFALTVDPALIQPVVPFTPNNGVVSDSSFWTIPPGLNASLSNFDDVLSINPTVAGNYNLLYTMTNDYGCTYDTSFNLVVNSNPLTNAGLDQTICDGVSTPVNLLATSGGSTAPCEYSINLFDTFGDSWNGNTLTVQIAGVSTTYTIANGDMNNIPVSVPNGAPITLTFNAIGNFVSECEVYIVNSAGATVYSNTTQITAPQVFTANCAPLMTYQWSPPVGLSNPNIANPIANVSTTQTYYVIGYPAGHPLCFTRDSMVISTLFTPFAGNNATLSLCSTAAPTNMFPLLGAGVATGGVWTGPGGIASNGTYTAASMNPGVYKYTVSSGSCIDFATVTVTEVVGDITNSVISNVTCNFGSDGSITISGLNFTDYSLDNGPLVPATSPFTVSNLTKGNYNISVTNPQGCADNLAFSITEPLPLAITLLADDTLICVDGAVNLRVSGAGGSSPYTYTWTANGNNIGTGNNIFHTPTDVTTIYCATLSEACGSPTVDSCFTVTQNVINDPTLSALNGCAPLDADISISNLPLLIDTLIVNYGDNKIAGFNTVQTNLYHTYIKPDSYDVSVYVRTPEGCELSKTFNTFITAYAVPVASFDINSSPVSNLNPEVLINNTSIGQITSYIWSLPGSATPTSTLSSITVNYPEGVVGIYPVQLIVTSQEGCIDSISRTVSVIEDVILYAPNVFTPDGDQYNQDWKIYISGIDIYDFELVLFNRWGQIIWESNDPTVGWDGSFNGKLVAQGMYNWKITTKDKTNDKKYSFQGHVSIIK